MGSIRSIGTAKSEDSKFVLDITRILYADEKEKLKSVSVTGRSKCGTKQCISPKKMSILKSMFAERINKIQKNQESEKEEGIVRMKTLNQLINRAICNLNTVTKNKSSNVELMAKINSMHESSDKHA